MFLIFATFSCSSGESVPELPTEGGPIPIADLAGNWEAASAGFLRISDDLWVDIVEQGGSVSLTVQSSGRCTFTIGPVDREVYTVSRKMSWGNYEGDEALTIVWDDSSDPDDRSYSRFFEITDTTFDLACPSECVEYDFNNNGTFEIADLSFSLVRD